MAKKWTSEERTTAFESDADLRSHNAISNRGRGGRRYAPWVFTEYSVVMAATVLDSERAIEASKLVIDVFIGLKRNLDGQKTTLSAKSWFTDFDPVLDNVILAGNPVTDEFAERPKVRRTIMDQNQNDECSVISDELNGSSTQNSSIKTHNLRSERHIFPDLFEFTKELGWIPEGWEVKRFGYLAQNVRGGVDPMTFPAETPYVGLEHFDKQCLSRSRWGTAAEVDSQKSHFKPDDFLFGKLRPCFHKICHDISEGICSTDILEIRPHKKDDTGYVGCQIFEPEFIEYANLRSAGTRMPRASWKDLAQYSVACPPDNLRREFNELIRPIREKCAGSVAKKHNLGQLRDTILLKLINGELSISESKNVHEEALA